jgi:hypothetical protein
VGRPIAPLVLSSDERAYLERQVRRRRVPRSLSDKYFTPAEVPDCSNSSHMAVVAAGQNDKLNAAAAYIRQLQCVCHERATLLINL